MSKLSLKTVPFSVRAFALVLVLSLSLGYMVAERLKILTTGTEVVLLTKPVDPRDLFRGHYARLNFNISRVTPSKSDKKYKRNSTIYVRLKPNNEGFWYAVSTSAKYSEPQAGTVVIKGTVKNSYSRPLQIRYGIERYFAPKAKALKLEAIDRKKIEVATLVRISPTGEAAISGLMIDGKKIYDEPLF